VTPTGKGLLIIAGLGIGAFLLGAFTRPKEVNDVQIDPGLGKHRGLAPTYGSAPENVPTRMPSAQDPKGGPADYLGYNYAKTTPSRYAMGEPAQHLGRYWDKREDAWAHPEVAPLDYQLPPLRIPKTWKDAIRYWDSIQSQGGTEVVGQSVHLFHLRPGYPTRGYRSISGSIASVGGGMSTASRTRIPAVFVPSAVS
jgi:hypothetical protein